MKNQNRRLPFCVNIYSEKGQINRVTLNQDAKFRWQHISSRKDKNLELQIEEWFEAYLSGKQAKENLPINLDFFTEYTQKVLKALCTIPFGTTKSYQEIAEHLANPKASRAVGTACGRNPILLFVPCHRVLRSNGNLGGFSAGIDLKKQLLAFEGILHE